MPDADEAPAPAAGAEFRNWVANFHEHAAGYFHWLDEVTQPHVTPQGCKTLSAFSSDATKHAGHRLVDPELIYRKFEQFAAHGGWIEPEKNKLKGYLAQPEGKVLYIRGHVRGITLQRHMEWCFLHWT